MYESFTSKVFAFKTYKLNLYICLILDNHNLKIIADTKNFLNSEFKNLLNLLYLKTSITEKYLVFN